MRFIQTTCWGEKYLLTGNNFNVLGVLVKLSNKKDSWLFLFVFFFRSMCAHLFSLKFTHYYFKRATKGIH